MSTLSLKIIRLLSIEAELEVLKGEIAEMHRGIIETVNEKETVSEELQQKLQEYESVSAVYNELFNAILEGSSKMKEEYAEAKKVAR